MKSQDPLSKGRIRPALDESTGSRILKYLLEILFLVVLFLLYTPGGVTTGIPGVNEPHYLCKAKHFWDPTFCEGDVFLESADAHYLFYFSLGLLTKFFSLGTSACIGRLICWTAIAMGWQFLLKCLTSQRFWSIPAAAILLLGIHHGHFAGEWLIGGVEAKALAYALVFTALGFMIQSRWVAVWIFLGLASAFHVLVGGWALIAVLLPWLADRGWKANWKGQLLAGGFGLLLSLLGLIPAVLLTHGQSHELVQEANQIYTFERIAHHLVFSHITQSDPQRLDAFLFMLLFWIGLQVVCFDFVRFRRLGYFVGGTVLIACGAIVIEWYAHRADEPELAARLLRFYWFRLFDVFVPAGIAVGLTVALKKILSIRYDFAAIGLSAVGCLFIGHCITSQINHAIQKRSHADRMTLASFPSNDSLNKKIVRDWIDVCTWIRIRLPRDSRFLTPRSQSTFKWYAQRSEVVSWKDVPQDALGIVGWRNRFDQVFGRYTFRFGLATLDAEQRILQLGKIYDADYVVMERRHVRARKQELEYRFQYQQFLLGKKATDSPFKKPLCLKQVYPDNSCSPEIRNDSYYLVYRLTIPEIYQPQLNSLSSMLAWYEQLTEWQNLDSGQ